MEDEYMTSKDAMFALDTTMEEDMGNYGEEVTNLVIKHINSTPKLYNYVKGNLKHEMSIEDSSTTWAKQHGDEFGDLFISELDSVDWERVGSMI